MPDVAAQTHTHTLLVADAAADERPAESGGTRLKRRSQRQFAWAGTAPTDPYEQNTRQSPCFGFKTPPQPVHS